NSVRITGATNRRLQIFAMTQIAASFMLLAGTSMLKTLVDMQNARTQLDTRRVLAVNLPVDSYGKTSEQINHFYEEIVRSVGQLPGVDAASVGCTAPWRDTASDLQLQFSADDHQKGAGEEDPRSQLRSITRLFCLAGRDASGRTRLQRSGPQGQRAGRDHQP